MAKTRKMSWIQFVMKHKKPGMSLGDAMKEASKHKKQWKHGGGDMGGVMEGGQLMGKGTVAGGAKKHKGGQLYTFAGGPYTESVLPDGAAPTVRMPGAEDVQWEGANPAALSGGKRRKHTRKTRKHRKTRGRKY